MRLFATPSDNTVSNALIISSLIHFTGEVYKQTFILVSISVNCTLSSAFGGTVSDKIFKLNFIILWYVVRNFSCDGWSWL